MSAYYIIHAKSMYRSNEKKEEMDWLNNVRRNEEGYSSEYIQRAINLCISDEVNERPDFIVL